MITSEGALIPAHAARPIAELVVRPTRVYLPREGASCKCGARLLWRIADWSPGTYQCECCCRPLHLGGVPPMSATKRSPLRRNSRGVIAESLITRYPPADGREWDCQCARCGSSVGKSLRPPQCLSWESWCKRNPLEGREAVERGQVEWFTFETRTSETTEVTE